MTSTIRFFVSAAAASTVLAGGAMNAPAQSARLRLGTLAPQGTSYHHILQSMGERWRTGTNGRVQLTVYAGTMGSETELVRRMRLGQLQVATITTTGLGQIDPAATSLQQMPLMFRDFDELAYVRQRLEPVLERRLAERGFVVLFWADAGWVRYFTRRPAMTPDDLRRQKIFVTAGETVQSDLMRNMGFTPVPLEWTDALTSLQTGLIDAAPTLPFFALTAQLYTVAKYMTNVNWVPLVGATVMTKRAWDALSPADQATLKAVAVQSGREFQARGRQESDESVAAMRQRGLTVVTPTPAAEAAWRSFGERIAPQVRGRLVPADMFDQVSQLLAEYRARNRR